MCFLSRTLLHPPVPVLLPSAFPGAVCGLWDQRCHRGLVLHGRGIWFPTQGDRRCDPSVEKRLWWEGEAGLNSALKLQHSSLPDPSAACTSEDVSQPWAFPKLNSFQKLPDGKFRVHWTFFIFVVRGKQILISLFQVYSPLSSLLILSGLALIYQHHAAFVKQYHKVRKRTCPKDYSKINYFRHREAA